MCIVVDTNFFHLVFRVKSGSITDYQPLLAWIINGKGKIVYGGKRYKKELRGASRYWKIFNEFKKAGKVIEISERDVDIAERAFYATYGDECNDYHIIAIVAVSGCKLVCTRDNGSIKHLKMSRYYRGNSRPPKIYRTKRNVNLLCNSNIADCCQPATKLGKTSRDFLAKACS